MVHLPGYAMLAEFGMYLEGHVEQRRPGGESQQIALGGEDIDLRREEIQLDRIEEIDGIGGGVGEDILDRINPLIELRVIVGFTRLILPVGGISQFGDLIHLA